MVFHHTVQNAIGIGPADSRLRPTGNGGRIRNIFRSGTFRASRISPQDGDSLLPCCRVVYTEGSSAIAGDNTVFCRPGNRAAIPGPGNSIRKSGRVRYGGRTAHAVQYRGKHSAGQGCLWRKSGIAGPAHDAVLLAVVDRLGIPSVSRDIRKSGHRLRFRCQFCAVRTRVIAGRWDLCRRAGGHGQEADHADRY